MKHFRLVVLFTLVALMVALVPASFAQVETFGLSTEDFELFTAANANISSLSDFAYDFTLDLLVSGIEDADISGTLNGVGAIGSGDGAFSLDVNGSFTADGETQPADIEIRVVGGNVYFNVGDQGWQGATLEELMAFGGSAAGGMGLPVNPEDLADGDLSGMEGMEGMSDAMADLASLDPSEYVSITRLDDEDGQAHFSPSLDICSLLSSEEFAGLIGGAMAMEMGGDSGEMTEEEVKQAGMMVAMMFGTATLTFDQYVNVETELVERAVLDIQLPLDQLLGEGALVSLTFDISLSNFGEPVTIEVPADVEMLEMEGES